MEALPKDYCNMHKTNPGTHQESKSNSVLYLALLCLLYLFITSNYLYAPHIPESYIDARQNIYIEISDGDGYTTIKSFTDAIELASVQSKYGINKSLKSGDRLILGKDKNVQLASISGLKRISLGIPIGINSAGADDLSAIPGIGPELASRIINYRESYGRFSSLDELDNVAGIGKRKLAEIKKSTNLD